MAKKESGTKEGTQSSSPEESQKLSPESAWNASEMERQLNLALKALGYPGFQET